MNIDAQNIKFARVSAGRYADAASGWTIERQGSGTARHDRADWYIKDPTGAVMRVKQTFAEAEIAAHTALSACASAKRDGAVAVAFDTPRAS